MKTILTFAFVVVSSSIFAQSISKTVENKQQPKTTVIGAWEFHAITLTTPKDGYLMRISERETGMMSLLVANYTFNKDGSITLDPKYMEKQGVKKATWKMDEPNVLTITYFWTAEKQQKEGFTNDYEKIDYTVKNTPNKNLILNLQNMFIVNLVSK